MQQQETRIEIPVGVEVRYLGENRIRVFLPEYRLDMTITRIGADQNRLTQDLGKFLAGEQNFPILSKYTIPWPLVAIALLPIGVAIIGRFGLISDLLTVALIGMCFGVAKQTRWPSWIRVILSLIVVAIGYFAILFLPSLVFIDLAR